MDFVTLHARWAPANRGDDIDFFADWLIGLADNFYNDGIIVDLLTDEQASDFTGGLFTASEVAFLIDAAFDYEDEREKV